MRPIDADALLLEVDELKKSPWYNGEDGNYERIVRQDAIGIIVDLCIKAAPTLDYAPVKHGKWLRANEEQVYFDVEYTCNECGFTVAVSGIGTPLLYGYNYCPNCGAKMDGKEGT